MPEVPRRGYFRIDLANNCNIRCIMCQAYNSLPVSAMEFLDFDKFQAMTRGELGKWDYIQLGNVAEATIHPGSRITCGMYARKRRTARFTLSLTARFCRSMPR